MNAATEYTVAQLGARMYYAVPTILHREGRLSRLYTDICAVRGWPRVLSLWPRSLRPSPVRRLLGRKPDGVPAELITSFTSFGFDYAQRWSRAPTTSRREELELWAGQEFCRLVIARAPDDLGAVYCFNTAGLELLLHARQAGMQSIVEQTIAPKAFARRLLEREHAKFPYWQEAYFDSAAGAELADRERKEWNAASLIICGSEFVRDSIGASGGPTGKCVVVPYGIAVPPPPTANGVFARPRARPLRVLTVGAVGLRKGSPYVALAAKALGKCAAFRMIGHIGVTPRAEQELRQHVELLGVVPRGEMEAHFSWADVFLLPSLCEGSATVTYEALSHGLPVICTPNTGSVVRDGVEGYIIPAGDSQAIADRIKVLAENRTLLQSMRSSAKSRAQAFTLQSYGTRLLGTLP